MLLHYLDCLPWKVTYSRPFDLLGISCPTRLCSLRKCMLMSLSVIYSFNVPLRLLLGLVSVAGTWCLLQPRYRKSPVFANSSNDPKHSALFRSWSSWTKSSSTTFGESVLPVSSEERLRLKRLSIEWWIVEWGIGFCPCFYRLTLLRRLFYLSCIFASSLPIVNLTLSLFLYLSSLFSFALFVISCGFSAM